MTDMSTLPFTADAFFHFLDEHKLMGVKCNDCGKLYIPPRAICAHCHSENLSWNQFSGEATLAAFTSISIVPTEMAKAGYGRDSPYLSGIVSLKEGVQISARLTGIDPLEPETIQIGTPMHVEFLKESEGSHPKLAFRPTQQPG